MAVLKYKDSEGVWHRLCQNGDISEAVIRQKTHEVVDDMVESLIPTTSTIAETIDSLKQSFYDDDTSWIDIKVQDVVNNMVISLHPTTSSNGELINALQSGSSFVSAKNNPTNGDTWVIKTIKNVINEQVGVLDSDVSTIKEVIEALQRI